VDLSAAYVALRDYFEASGLDLDEHPEDGWLATEGFGEHGSWLLVGQVYEKLDAVAVYSVLPHVVPAERRTAVALLCTRINYGLVIGNFELDLDDGEIRFKASIGGSPGAAELKRLVAAALTQVDRWLPALEAVVRGEDPGVTFDRVLAA
jgi:hypothetical protein